MMTRYYQFAGIKFAVTMPQDLFYENEYRLEPFHIEATNPDQILIFEQKAQLSPPEGVLVAKEPGLHCYVNADRCIRYIGVFSDDSMTATIRIEYCGNVGRAEVKYRQLPMRISVKYVLECMAAEHMIAQNQGFVFHCSFIDNGGKAILFTAPSETGKSTQAELWKQHRGAQIINGDRAAVRLYDGVLLAEGIPFAGSSKYCKNRSLPIEAIVYLGQASRTTIRKLQGYEAFAKIWEGICVNTWDKTDMEYVSAVVQKAATEIPVFHLTCTPDESAVTALEEAMRKLVNL